MRIRGRKGRKRGKEVKEREEITEGRRKEVRKVGKKKVNKEEL